MKKTGSKPITSFFKPKPKQARLVDAEQVAEEDRGGQDQVQVPVPLDEGAAPHLAAEQPEPMEVDPGAIPGAEGADVVEQVPEIRDPVGEWDVGEYVLKLREGDRLTDYEKYMLLTETWAPGPNYDWPYEKRVTKQREFVVKLKPDHLKHGIAYSHVLNGLFCVHCVLFAPEFVGKGKANKPGQFVNQPCRKYAKLFGGGTGYIDNHLKSDFHKDSIVASNGFKGVFKTRDQGTHSMDIQQQLKTKKAKEVEENREKLGAMVDTIILCGQLNIPLRGHRDSGGLDLDLPVHTEKGNFLRLIAERAKFDPILRKHIQDAAKNATYLSPRIQNELISCCGEAILQKLLPQIRKAGFFSILADETSDVALVEQFSLGIRLFDEDVGAIREEFVGFSEIRDLTGLSIADHILQRLRSLNLDPTHVVGLGFDGAANMSGQFRGAQAILRQTCTSAVYVHCLAHSLNLVVSKASEIPELQSAMRTLSGVINPFTSMIW